MSERVTLTVDVQVAIDMLWIARTMRDFAEGKGPLYAERAAEARDACLAIEGALRAHGWAPKPGSVDAAGPSEWVRQVYGRRR